MNLVKRKVSEMPTKKSRYFRKHIKNQVTDRHLKMLEGFTHDLSEVPVLFIMLGFRKNVWEMLSRETSNQISEKFFAELSRGAVRLSCVALDCIA